MRISPYSAQASSFLLIVPPSDPPREVVIPVPATLGSVDPETVSQREKQKTVSVLLNQGCCLAGRAPTLQGWLTMTIKSR